MSPELIERIRLASVGVQTTSVRGLAEGFLDYTAKHCSRSTLPARKCRINRLVAFLESAGIHDISSVNNAVLSIYFDQLKDAKPSSQNASRKTVKSFINWIEGAREIDTPVKVNSIAIVKEGKRNPRYLRSEDIETMINNRNIPFVDRLILACGSLMGLRAGEIAGIRMKDMHGDEIEVVGKGDNQRIVTIPSVVSTMVDLYLQMSPYPLSDDDYLFQTRYKHEWKCMTAKTIWRRLKTIFEHEGFPEASTHWLRHSYAVGLLLKGCDLITIQKSLGHSDLKVTQKYLNIANEIVKENIHKHLG